MGRATTRKAIIHKYTACKDCSDNVTDYGKCNKGYDNFYYRRGKDNKCEKCRKCEEDRRLTEKINNFINSKI